MLEEWFLLKILNTEYIEHLSISIFSLFLSNFVLEASIKKYEKEEIKHIKFEKSKAFCRDGMIVYIDNPKEFTEKY